MKNMSITRICMLLTLILVSSCSVTNNNNVSDDVTEPALIEENMVEGELIELSQEELVIKNTEGTETTLNLSGDSVYWDNIEWLTVFPMEQGDQITAYGEWTTDHTSFNVDRYYNNRLILKGIVTYSSGEAGGFMVNQPDQNYAIFPLPERTELLTTIPDDPRSFRHFKLLPRPAEYLEVVGRKINDNYVVAVTLTRFE